MKWSLFKNDKSTAADEGMLFLFILACISIGALLLVFAPTFWIIDEIMTKAIGILFVLTGVLFIPGLIYRLLTNDRLK